MTRNLRKKFKKKVLRLIVGQPTLPSCIALQLQPHALYNRIAIIGLLHNRVHLRQEQQTQRSRRRYKDKSRNSNEGQRRLIAHQIRQDDDNSARYDDTIDAHTNVLRVV